MSSSSDTSCIFVEPRKFHIDRCIFDLCTTKPFGTRVSEDVLLAAMRVESDCDWSHFLTSNAPIQQPTLTHVYVATDQHYKITCLVDGCTTEGVEKGKIFAVMLHSALINAYSNASKTELGVYVQIERCSIVPILDGREDEYAFALQHTSFISRHPLIAQRVETYWAQDKVERTGNEIKDALKVCQSDLSKLIAVLPISGLDCVDSADPCFQPLITSTQNECAENCSAIDGVMGSDSGNSVDIHIVGSDGLAIKRFCPNSRHVWKDVTNSPKSRKDDTVWVRHVRIQTNPKMTGWTDDMSMNCDCDSQRKDAAFVENDKRILEENDVTNENRSAASALTEFKLTNLRQKCLCSILES